MKTIDKDREIIKVYDDHGFLYSVELLYTPSFGFATAYYRDSIIAQSELGGRQHTRPPASDDDREWEEYEERLADWKNEIKENIIPLCKEHFNRENI